MFVKYKQKCYSIKIQKKMDLNTQLVPKKFKISRHIESLNARVEH